MGVKETPMVPAQEEPVTAEETPKEETPAEESKKEEVAQILEPKPKKRAATKKAPAAPKKAPTKKKETIDLKQRTICPICKCNLSMHALLYTHSCTKEALQKKKVAPVFDDAVQKETKPPQDEEETSLQNEVLAPPPLTRQPANLEVRDSLPPVEEPLIRQPTYAEILQEQQAELRRQKSLRIVNPIRQHFFGHKM